MADVMWVKWPKDLSAENKSRKTDDALNLTRNPRQWSHHFNKEKLSTDGYASGDPGCTAWTDWEKLLAQGKDQKGTDLRSPG